MVLLTTGGTFLVVDRELGLLRRLAASPYSKTEIVLGKVLARFATGITQAAFAMLAGTVLFRVDWGNHLMGVLLVLCLFVFSGSTLSVLVGSLARSRGQAVGLGVLLGNVLSALGGCWWPIEIVAPIMQKLAWCLPTGWAMYALHRLISFGDGIGATAVVASAISIGGRLSTSSAGVSLSVNAASVRHRSRQLGAPRRDGDLGRHSYR